MVNDDNNMKLWGEFESYDGGGEESREFQSISRVGSRDGVPSSSSNLSNVVGNSCGGSNQSDAVESCLSSLSSSGVSPSDRLPHQVSSQLSLSSSSSLDSFSFVRDIMIIPQIPDSLFKCQHKDEPQLTTEEKIKIAIDLLSQNPLGFLVRFRKYFPENHLHSLANLYKDDVDCQNYIKRILKDKTVSRNIQKKNRRYAALNRMIKSGDAYFSEEAMKLRNPSLYHRTIGKIQAQTLSSDIDNPDCRLSSIILQHYDLNRTRELQKEQENEENVYEIEDDEVEMDLETMTEEFKRLMHQSFIDGKEKDFDYSTIDDDESLDDLEILERDLQDKYFDHDDDDVRVEPEVNDMAYDY